MGGQACVFYGAAEFSRDLDLLIVADPANLQSLQRALDTLRAEPVAVPPFDADFLERGHAVHFRCKADDVAGLRIDIMSKLRGVASSEELWARRTSIEVAGVEIDLLSIQDLVRAKKTQRNKDWPMIQRLLERAYFDLPAQPVAAQIDFLLQELRTPELLQELIRNFPEHAARIERPAVRAALDNCPGAVETALTLEQDAERRSDRIYWDPLKRELEQLRRARRNHISDTLI